MSLASFSSSSTSSVVGLFRLFDSGGHDFGVGAKPVGLLDELTVMDLKDLHPAAALVVLRGYLERWDQAAEGEIPDLLEPILHIGAGRLLAAIGFESVAAASSSLRSIASS